MHIRPFTSGGRLAAAVLVAAMLPALAGCQGAPEAAMTDPAEGRPAPRPAANARKTLQTAPLARTMWTTSRLFGAVGADTDRVDIRFDPDGVVVLTAYRRNGSVGTESQRYGVDGAILVTTSDLGAVSRSRFEMNENEMILDTPNTRGILKRIPWQASSGGAPAPLQPRTTAATAGAGGQLAGTSWVVDVVVGKRGDLSGGALEFGTDGWMSGRITTVNGSSSAIQRRYRVQGGELILTDDLGQTSTGTFTLIANKLTIDMPDARIVLFRRN